jgi:hypothetical protein
VDIVPPRQLKNKAEPIKVAGADSLNDSTVVIFEPSAKTNPFSNSIEIGKITHNSKVRYVRNSSNKIRRPIAIASYP